MKFRGGTTYVSIVCASLEGIKKIAIISRTLTVMQLLFNILVFAFPIQNRSVLVLCENEQSDGGTDPDTRL